MSKDIRKLYKKVARAYLKEYAGKSPYDKNERPFLALLSKRARILDAGCGPGIVTAAFLKQGFRVEGVDISPEMIKLARQTVPKAKFRVMDLRNLKYPTKIFDAVYCFGVFEHIPKAQTLQTLKGFARVLKNRGLLFLTCTKGKGERPIYWQLAKQKIKVSLYSASELNAAVAKAGFKVLRCEVAPPYSKSYYYSIIFITARKIK